MEYKIHSYSDSDYDALNEMLAICFHQDYKMPLTKEQLDMWQNTLIRYASAEVVFIDILTIDDAAQGFILYQIDSPESDWCVKEGYGFIRELYVAANLRGRGYGKALVSHAESQLKRRCVPRIYLTTDDATDFWIKMNYQDSGEICSSNNMPIFIK